MTIKTLVWRGLDAPRMEVTHFESWSSAHGTQLNSAYELRWELMGDLLRVGIIGETVREFALGDADFFDLLASPFFNSLPAVRDGLFERGPPRDYVMCFVRHPEIVKERSRQRYTPLGDHIIHYSSGGFEADIEFDEEGFVTLYHGYLERIS